MGICSVEFICWEAGREPVRVFVGHGGLLEGRAGPDVWSAKVGVRQRTAPDSGNATFCTCGWERRPRLDRGGTGKWMVLGKSGDYGRGGL